MKTTRAIRKQLFIETLGGKCVSCGTTENLQFDHIITATKSFDISQRLDYSISQLQKELQKCQLLCASCHGSKTRVDAGDVVGFVHGRHATYMNYGCRCDLCKSANADYYRVYKNKLMPVMV